MQRSCFFEQVYLLLKTISAKGLWNSRSLLLWWRWASLYLRLLCRSPIFYLSIPFFVPIMTQEIWSALSWPTCSATWWASRLSRPFRPKVSSLNCSHVFSPHINAFGRRLRIPNTNHVLLVNRLFPALTRLSFFAGVAGFVLLISPLTSPGIYYESHGDRRCWSPPRRWDWTYIWTLLS